MARKVKLSKKTIKRLAKKGIKQVNAVVLQDDVFALGGKQWRKFVRRGLKAMRLY